jgi:hypothetical protein
MFPHRPTSTRTLGAELQRDRLERRVRSMTVAIDSLLRYSSEPRREPPRHVRQVVADFDAQIAAMNARLRKLAHDSQSTADEE